MRLFQKAQALVLLLTLCVSVSCGPLRHIGESEPRIGTVYQRMEYDCGVAALAMLHRTVYEAVWKVTTEKLLFAQQGLTDLDMRSMSLRLNRMLYIKRVEPTWNIKRSLTAILHIVDHSGAHHYVYHFDGIIYDPSPFGNVSMTYSNYTAFRPHRVVTILTLEPVE